MTRPKPVIVGGFVLGALALAVIAILAFGGMNLFAHKLRVVVVFSDSIAGLEAGAPVTFRGARIGRVDGMRLHIDVRRQTSWLPVYLVLDLDRIAWTDGSVGSKRDDLQAAVNSGLRAQLVSQGSSVRGSDRSPTGCRPPCRRPRMRCASCNRTPLTPWGTSIGWRTRAASRLRPTATI
jgi:paraquat-inducible protein B